MLKEKLMLIVLIVFLFIVGCNHEKEHEHDYIEGKCECGDVDPNYVTHTHNYVGGKCECGVIDEVYMANHGHYYNNGVCECGEKEPVRKYVTIDNVNYALNDEETHYIVTGCEYEASDVFIQEKIDGLFVRAINSFAFYNCDNLKNITVPSSVTDIGESAFYSCGNLQNIIIPESVVTIGEYAFKNCDGLNYNVKGNEKYLGNEKNPYLVLFDIVSDDAISCIIDKNAKIVMRNVIRDNINITSFEVEEGNNYYKSIDGSLYTKNGETLICYPRGKTSTECIIPNSVAYIDDYAFSDCTNLNSIIIPESIKDIGEYAFDNCKNLKYNIYDNAKYLGNSENLYLILIGSTNKDIVNCDINENTKIIYNGSFMGCNKIESISIPENVLMIKNDSLSYCSNLKEVYISSSVEVIEKSAFYENNNLLKFDVDSNNQYYKSIDGNLYSKDGTILIKYCLGKKDTVFEIPTEVKSIDSYALDRCRNLREIILPEGIEEISIAAFYYCYNLEKITIPSTVKSIERFAFYGCEKLENIFIPSSVEKIGESAFEMCSTLKIVQFADNSNLKYIHERAFFDCRNLQKIILPDKLTSIGEFAFYGCGNIITIEIPKNVMDISNVAFMNCYQLSGIEVNSNNQYYKSVDGNLYSKDGKKLIKYANGKLENNFIIPEGVNEICEYAFCLAYNLHSVYIPKDITIIQTMAFHNCHNLTIYCGAESPLEGWAENWSYGCPVFYGF